MIQAQFLHDVADYVDSRIEKVVLNNSYEITDFQVKAVTDSTVALNYIVPAANISLITQIDLKDPNNILISSDAVNVPVPSDTLMLQTIEVKEVTA